MMNRKVLDAFSIVVLAAYVELKHLHLLTPNDDLHNGLGTLFTLLLAIPCISVMVRVLDLFSSVVTKNPLVIQVKADQLHGKAMGTGVVFKAETPTDYSQPMAVIDDPNGFAENLSKVIGELVKGGSKISLAPYVILVYPGGISESVDIRLRELVRHAGAVHCVVIDREIDASGVTELIKQNPVDNFA